MASTKASPSSKKVQVENVNTEVLCDEHWKCDVIFLYEGDKEGQNLISILGQTPVKQLDGGINVINKTDLLKEVKKSGGKPPKAATPKGQKSKDENVELTDEQKILKCIKENTTIPGKPLASVIKKYLIKLKIDSINQKKKHATREGSNKKKAENKNQIEPVVEKPPVSVILFGFSEHDLPLELIKLNVPLRAVVKILGDMKPVLGAEKPQSEILNSGKFIMSWLNFWRNFDALMNIPDNAENGIDLLSVNFRFPPELLDQKLNLKDKKANALNQLTNIMTYVRSMLTQHELYANKLVSIDLDKEFIIEYPDLYEMLMKMVPLESVSVPLILFSLIEQVCHWNGDVIEIENEDYEESGRSCSTASMKRHLKCRPAIIRHNDLHSLKTFHVDVPEIDFNKIIVRFLSKSFLFKPWLENQKDQMRDYFFEFHLQRLWKLAYKEIHLKLFYIYLHWYILCRMKFCETSKLKINDNRHFDNIEHICNSSYYNKSLQEWLNMYEENDENQFSDRSSDVSCSYASTKDYNDFINNKNSATVMPNDNEIDTDFVQELNPIKNYKTVEIMKKERNHNLLVLKKFLSCSEILCLCESNESPSAINKYLKKFADYNCIEEMAPLSLLQSIHESLSTYSKVHSIHYYPSNKILLWFHNSKECILEDCKTGVLDTALGLRDYYVRFVEPNEDVSLKQKDQVLKTNEANVEDSKRNSQMKYDLTNDHGEEIEAESEEVSPVYNVDKKMVKFDQVTRRFFSKDGTTITVEIENWYKLSQYVHVCINKIDVEMNMYVDKLFIMNYEQSQLPINEPTETMKLSVNLPNGTLLNLKVKESVENSNNTICTNFLFSDFIITLPTGLVIEAVKNVYKNNDLYIRQSYTAKGPNCNKIWNEKCRCFDRSGTVVIFKDDGTINVIYGSTAMASINQVGESVVEPIIQPEIIQEPIPTGKPKKSKQKKAKEIAPKEIEPEVELYEDKIEILPYRILEHSIKTWSGQFYSYKEGVKTGVIKEVNNLRTYLSANQQLYTERNDGVKSLLDENGKLVSTYNDGTILTVYSYEESEENDLEKTNSANEISKTVNDTYKESTGSIESENIDAKSDGEEVKEEGKKEGKEEDNYNEMFNCYKIGCTLEHPNFAIVDFSPSDDSIKLSLPDDITITILNIQNNSTYDISVNIKNKAGLTFTKESIEFKSSILKSKNKSNITTITPIFVQPSSNTSDLSFEDYNYFCKTIDTFNRKFFVDKFGDVILQNPYDADNKDTNVSFNLNEHYYENTVPKKMAERFFVVNENFSGYEVISQSDVHLMDIDDEKQFKYVDVAKNPTKNRISSKTSQYYVFKTHSEQYLCELDFSDILPSSLQRAALSPPWTPEESPWLLVRPGRKSLTYNRFFYTNKHTDKRIQAVVVKTIQQVSDPNSFNSLDIIFYCLKKYKKENEQFLDKYKKQGYTDINIDARLKENHSIITSIKKELPLWNVLRKECHTCKQTFGSPLKRVGSSCLTFLKHVDNVEKVVDKVEYT